MRYPRRESTLAQRLSALEEELEQGATFLPRIFLVETELLRDLVAAELPTYERWSRT